MSSNRIDDHSHYQWMPNGSVMTTRWLQSTYVMLRITYAENPKKQQGNSPLSSLDLQLACVFSPILSAITHLTWEGTWCPGNWWKDLLWLPLPQTGEQWAKDTREKIMKDHRKKKVTLFQWPLSNLCTNKGNVLKCCCLNKLFNEREYS